VFSQISDSQSALDYFNGLLELGQFSFISGNKPFPDTNDLGRGKTGKY